MVATIDVITGNVHDASRYYITLYYAGQPTGIWLGNAAKSLGVTGVVTEDTFEKLLCGQAPCGAQLVKQLVLEDETTSSQNDGELTREDSKKNSKKKKKKKKKWKKKTWKNKNNKKKTKKKKKKKQNVLGLDQTYSVTKELSILWAMSTPAQRQRIEEAILMASRATTRWIEQNLMLARRGKNGRRRIPAKLVVAQFLHTLSRAGEPHLHVHNVFSQLVEGADGRWSKIDTSQLFIWTPAIGRIFRANLAHELTKEFGLTLTLPEDEQGKKQTCFAIEGVPKEIVDLNSSRRKQILEASGPHGLAKGKYAALVRQHAAINTREDKDPNINLEEVFAKVQQQADELGFTKDKMEQLFGKSELPQQNELEPLLDTAFKNALKTLTEEVAHFRECDIVSKVVEEIQHLGYDGAELATRVVDEIPHRPELIQLKEYRREKQFTTKEMWDLEAKFLEDVKELRSRTGATLTNVQIDNLLAKNSKLSSEQKECIRSVLSGEGAIRIVTGIAGSGKTTAIEVVRAALEQEKYRVLGGALAGATTQDFAEKTGIESRTVASHVYQFNSTESQKVVGSGECHSHLHASEVPESTASEKMKNSLDSNTVLVIDEAGMLSTKDLARLVKIVKKADATLLLLGDVAQLPAIGAGAPLKRLAHDIKHVHLDTNYRQENPDDKAALSQLRNGESENALDNFASRERLIFGDDHFDTVERLVSSWKDGGGTCEPQRHVILSQTRADVKLVNSLCQAERIANADVSLRRSFVFAETMYCAGDRVLFHQANHKLGIQNGHFARITAINAKRQEITVRLERERTPRERAKGLGQSVVVSLADVSKDFLSLGYACTSHKLQGATVDHSYVLLSGPLCSKEMSYVQASRARLSTHLFADRKAAEKDREGLERSLRRSRAKNMAHDLGRFEQNH